MFGEGERLAAQVQLYITILVSEPPSTRTATIACLRTLIVDLTQEIGAEKVQTFLSQEHELLCFLSMVYKSGRGGIKARILGMRGLSPFPTVRHHLFGRTSMMLSSIRKIHQAELTRHQKEMVAISCLAQGLRR